MQAPTVTEQIRLEVHARGENITRNQAMKAVHKWMDTEHAGEWWEYIAIYLAAPPQKGWIVVYQQ